MISKTGFVLLFLIVGSFGLSPRALADIVIDWTTITMPTTQATAAQITTPITFAGSTTGDEAIPFIVTLSRSAGTNAWYYRASQGGVANSLIFNMGDQDVANNPVYGRATTDRINFSVTFAYAPTVVLPTGLYWASTFTALDIDIGASVANWQDRLTINTAGASLSRPAGSTVIFDGNKFTGTTNVANTSSAGNATATYNSLPLTFSFSYTPGPQDGLTGPNQLIGINGVGFTQAIPEPSAAGVAGILVLFASSICRRRKPTNSNPVH